MALTMVSVCALLDPWRGSEDQTLDLALVATGTRRCGTRRNRKDRDDAERP